MPVSDISDMQLYALMTNIDLLPQLREMVQPEFSRRNFTDEYLSELQADYERIVPRDNTVLATRQKIMIAIMSPTFTLWFIGAPVHCWLANQFISEGQYCKWRQYWQYLAVGYLFWTVLAIVIAKLFLKY